MYGRAIARPVPRPLRLCGTAHLGCQHFVHLGRSSLSTMRCTASNARSRMRRRHRDLVEPVAQRRDALSSVVSFMLGQMADRTGTKVRAGTAAADDAADRSP